MLIKSRRVLSLKKRASALSPMPVSWRVLSSDKLASFKFARIFVAETAWISAGSVLSNLSTLFGVLLFSAKVSAGFALRRLHENKLDKTKNR